MNSHESQNAAVASAWGDDVTQYFFELTPDRILDAVEQATGLRCTGRLLALNSMENRVFEVELDQPDWPKWERSLICKFYRPGRWSKEAILDEHTFLQELVELEIPVVAPRALVDGTTLVTTEKEKLHLAIFPKFAGRSPDELTDEQLERAGRMLARIHNVGSVRKASHRLTLSVETYGLVNLDFLLRSKSIPESIVQNYKATVEAICKLSAPLFDSQPAHRIHGDCHLGNLLFGKEGLFFVDFDDMLNGPAVQDIWLLTPGRDDEALRQRGLLIRGYEVMRPFNQAALKLIEPLRALRIIHFSAWIARRWKDPSFPRAFPQFGTDRYWQEQLRDLREQLAFIQEAH